MTSDRRRRTWPERADAAERANDALDRATRDLPTLSRTAARQHARTHVRTTRTLLTTDPPPPTVTEPATDEPERPDVCDVCGEPDGELLDDVVANYWDPKTETTRLAHPDCADGRGWTPA